MRMEVLIRPPGENRFRDRTKQVDEPTRDEEEDGLTSEEGREDGED